MRLNSSNKSWQLATSWQKITIIGLFLLYAVAGVNHFVNPAFYIAIIPPYLPFAPLLNKAAGVAEMALSLLLVSKRTRWLACAGIVSMLIVFIPVHVYTITKVNCGERLTCNGIIIPWLRFFVVHPFLIAWPVYVMRWHSNGQLN